MFLIALALAAASPPDRWVHLGGSTGVHDDYLDQESVRRSGTKVTLWTRRDLALGRGTAWNELELDCKARTGAVLAWVRDDGGVISHNVARPHSAAAPIEPRSAEEKVFDLVCG